MFLWMIQEHVNSVEIPKLTYRRRYHSLDHWIVDDSISRVNTSDGLEPSSMYIFLWMIQEDVNELEIPKLTYRRRYHSLDHWIVNDSVSRVNTSDGLEPSSMYIFLWMIQEDVNSVEIPKLTYRRRYHSLDHGIVDDSISRVNTC